MVGRLNANSVRRSDALAVPQIKRGGIFPTIRWKKAKPANADLVPGKAVQLLIVPNAAKHFRLLSSRKSRVLLLSLMSADNWKIWRRLHWRVCWTRNVGHFDWS